MSEPTRPRSEPEIIPPDRSARPERTRSRRAESKLWASVGSQEGARVYIAKPGPLGIILGAVAVGAVLGMTLLALVGAFLFSLPVIGAIVAALVLSTLIRRYFRALR
ncbi:MAG: hypothetical protein JWL84_2324 [Rhodospirillales bacterium]|nr:hypothetical protein [Rhodospirillales bacterium]